MGQSDISFFGQRPRWEPEGTKSCRIQGGICTSVHMYVRASIPPPKAPQRLVGGSQRLAQVSQRPA